MGGVLAVLTASCGVVGACGVALLLVPARQARLRRWLGRAEVEHDDSTVLAVQAASARGAVAAAALLVVLWVAFLLLGLKAVGLALALPLAALLAVALPVGGGVRRRAVLGGRPVVPGGWRGPAGLLVAGTVLAAALLGVQVRVFRPEERLSGTGVDGSTVLPELEVYTLPVLAAVALAVPAVVAVVRWVVARRPGLSGAASDVDVLVRRHHRRLALRAGAAAQLVLAAVLVRVAPLLTEPPVADPRAAGPLVGVAAAAALVLVAVALAVTVRGLSLDPRAAARRGWSAELVVTR